MALQDDGMGIREPEHCALEPKYNRHNSPSTQNLPFLFHIKINLIYENKALIGTNLRLL